MSRPLNVFCKNCAKVVAAEIRATASGWPTSDIAASLPEPEDGFHRIRYALAFCGACDSVFLHRQWTTEPSEILFEEILYPRTTEALPVDIPMGVRRARERAASCLDTANWEPCVLMCRKTIENMCAALGEAKGTLKEKLKRLRDAGRIEPRMCDWAEELRLAGNEAAHDDLVDFSAEDARDCLDFVDAIILYLYTLDKKFSDFRSRRRAPDSR